MDEVDWQGKAAGQSTHRLLLAALGPDADTGKLDHAYNAAFVVTVVFAVLAAVCTIVIQIWRMEQRLRAEGRVGTGACFMARELQTT